MRYYKVFRPKYRDGALCYSTAYHLQAYIYHSRCIDYTDGESCELVAEQRVLIK